jgi:osmotically-inducible protein OsmY
VCCRTDGGRRTPESACLYRHGRSTMKTDAQPQQDVIAELAWEPSVNATQIGVEVKDGVRTLAWHVGSFISTPRRNQGHGRSGLDHAHGRSPHISVAVNGANVTLTGTVHSYSDRDSARDSAWATPGVCNVADNLTVVY